MKKKSDIRSLQWLRYFSRLINNPRNMLCLLMAISVPGLARQADDEVTRGELRLRTATEAIATSAPQLHTIVNMHISGMVGRVQVKQTFRNPSENWVEGIYVFPLPDNAAVDHLRMWIGERFIEADVMERAAAEKTYQQAKAAGKQTTLLRQERPNVFTTQVANIPPGSEIVVEIEYQQQIQYQSGEFSVRFPMVVAPRYIPGQIVEPEYGRLTGNGWAENTDQVPDASLITPAVLADTAEKINPVEITIELDPGFALAYVDSPYHAIVIEETAQNKRHVRLAQGEVPAERDFELRWATLPGNTPQAALFSEDRKDGYYSMLMMMPPMLDANVSQPRELILVVDTSGSMHGDSIAQAKQSLKIAVNQLMPVDRFNIIQFNTDTSSLYRFSVQADAGNRADAIQYIDSLQADGGTEMYPALQQALAGDVEPGYLRQVMFLTDGSVGNEQVLYKLIADQLADTRLFTVGIGSAPNSYFMTRAAEFGRGTFTYIGDVREVNERMQALFEKLRSPALTDIQVTWEGVEVKQWPSIVPDLYSGEPIVLSAYSQHPATGVVISGNIGGHPWSRRLVLGSGAEAEGIHVLWARSQIKQLMAAEVLGNDEQEVRGQILEVALAHHLVSKYTSLVAVDKTPVRPVDKALQSKAMPTNMPKGWSSMKVFGQLPQTATPAGLQLLIGILALLLILFVTRRRVVL